MLPRKVERETRGCWFREESAALLDGGGGQRRLNEKVAFGQDLRETREWP